MSVLALLLIALAFWLRPVSFLNGYYHLRLYLAGGRSRSIDVNGRQIHYNVLGHGPALVLIHGLGGRAENWQYLAHRLIGHRVYMLDMPGFGRSQSRADFSYSPRAQAAVVIGFLDALGLHQVDLGGWSMGGWIAQLIASQQPDRIRKLILFSSAGLRDRLPWEPALFFPTNLEEWHQFQAMLMPNPPRLADFIAWDFLRMNQRNAPVVARTLHAMRSGQDCTDEILPQLKMPVLIVWGAKDRIIPPSHAHTHQRLAPQSQLELMPDLGHLAVIEGASSVAPLVLQFLKRR